MSNSQERASRIEIQMPSLAEQAVILSLHDVIKGRDGEEIVLSFRELKNLVNKNGCFVGERGEFLTDEFEKVLRQLSNLRLICLKEYVTYCAPGRAVRHAIPITKAQMMIESAGYHFRRIFGISDIKSIEINQEKLNEYLLELAQQSSTSP